MGGMGIIYGRKQTAFIKDGLKFFVTSTTKNSSS